MNFFPFLCVLGIFLLSSTPSLSLIRECSTIQEILSLSQPDTLVILDIDNTLIRPCQSLGSEEWFQHHLKQQIDATHDNNEALNTTIDLLHGIYAVTKVQLMEQKTAEIVRQLQDQGGVLMGLTNRGPAAANMTVRHLASVGIDLATASPSKTSFPLIDISETLYHHGILFTNGKSKKQSLLSFFRQLGWRPRRIVYVNDQRKYLEEVSTFENEGILFVGLRFTGGDLYSRNFNSQLCDIELEAFLNLISDDAATKELQKL
jgi:hypothetical protein